MDRQYKSYFELIVLGHNGGLTPEEIYDRFTGAGLSQSKVPPVSAIRRIGRNILGPECRWSADRMRSWSNGSMVRVFNGQSVTHIKSKKSI